MRRFLHSADSEGFRPCARALGRVLGAACLSLILATSAGSTAPEPKKPTAENAAPAPAAEPAAPSAATPAPAEGKPAPETAPARLPAPPLVVSGISALEILARDYEETVRFYTEVLGFREQDASGGEGERRCTLVAGPVRLRVREQPGKPVRQARHPWLGVYPVALSEVSAEAAGLKEAKGVVVDDLVPQGPAGSAGLLKGDIILAVEGKETPSPEALTAVVRSFAPGKKTLVTVWREGKKRDLPVALLESPIPDQLAPMILRLAVRDLDAYYREVLRRSIRIYAEPQEVPGGGRVLEIIDPNDVLVVLEEGVAAQAKPAEGEKPAAEDAKPQEKAQ